MVKTAAFTICSVFVLLLPQTASAARCDTGGEILDENRDVRVYRVSDHVVGCSKASGRRTELANRGEKFSQLHLAGKLAAFSRHGSCDTAEECWSAVVVVTLKAGKELVHEKSAGNERFRVTDLVLKPNHSVAWIQWGHDDVVSVRKTDSTGGNVVLASGFGIETDTLALSASRLYWAIDAIPQSAALL